MNFKRPPTTAYLYSSSSFPTELLHHIANKIESLETLRAFSCVNSRFYAIFNPVLYQLDARQNKALGSIAVTWAAQHGKLDILKRAVKHGAAIPPCPREKNKKKSLGFFKRWKRIPGEIWSEHVRDERTDHPLCKAVRYGHADITKYLINHVRLRQLSLIERCRDSWSYTYRQTLA